MGFTWKSRRNYLIGLGLAAIAAGCNRVEAESGGDVAYNWDPARSESVAGVPTAAVQSAIQARLEGEAPADVAPDLWKHVDVLYKAYDGTPLWMDSKGPIADRTSALIRALTDAHSDALRLEEYPIAALAQAIAAVRHAESPTAEQLAHADVLLSSAYLALAEDLLSGQTNPKEVTNDWHIDFKHEKLDSAVVRSLRADRLDVGIARMRPEGTDYQVLRQGLQELRQVVASGGWNTVPEGKPLKVNDRDAPTRLAALRTRLAAEGIAVPADTGRVYTRQLSDAVSQFQAQHAINVDGILGAETVKSMNVSADFRLAQVAANLERHRWLPRFLGERYIFVNVPAFRLQAYDGTGVALDMKVIVGEEYEGRTTPAFSDQMDHVVFRPYWNVTPDIQSKELEPKFAQNPGYMEANNYEYWSDGGTRRIRQTPGPKNSLGLVKFMFPNSYNIYLHDTPSRSLFQRDVRAFSHGCIRVENPNQLAQWALGWDEARVEEAMQRGNDNRTVRLERKIPVYIAYFTAYEKDGRLHFGNDLYSKDEDLARVMNPGARPSAAMMQQLESLRKLVEG
ncbi:MAG: L,D-transpeptidase family protein [Gemmatimonadaceae bacterium]|nr:L,D-transpeptidase family protein [Gemmatimonadaceae bacterium]